MTTLAPLLDRAELALAERAGADLLSYRSGRELTTLAKGDTVSRDVGVLKAGRFHGGDVTLDAADLEAIASRFDLMFPDVFVPPFRLDHGMSVTEVVGYFEALRVVELADPSNGGKVTAYLVGDVRWIDDGVVEDLRRPLEKRRLRNRSSEIGKYETNAGEVYPLVLYGCAFVDIPAVEGLDAAPIRLRQIAPPAVLTVLSEGSTVSETTVETTVETSAETPAAPPVEGTLDTATPDEGDEDGSAAPDNPAGTPADEDAAGPDDKPAPDSGDGSADFPAAEPSPDTPSGATALAATRPTIDLEALRGQDAESALRALGLTALADELVGMRQSAIELRVGKYAALVTPATGAHLRSLLGHRDPAVVASTEAVLEVLAARGPALTADRPVTPATTDNGRVIQLGMTPEEVGPAWAALGTDGRKARQNEFDEWNAARAGS